jgi:hypothetical protein
MTQPFDETNRIATTIRTMMAAGFLLDAASVKPGYDLLPEN